MVWITWLRSFCSTIVDIQGYDVTEKGPLSLFNDQGLTFDQISDIIEEQL
jgi:hypothetical protein